MCVARRTVAALQPLVDRITTAGGHVGAYALDARREDQVVGFFNRIEAQVGAIEAVVFNVGAIPAFRSSRPRTRSQGPACGACGD